MKKVIISMVLIGGLILNPFDATSTKTELADKIETGETNNTGNKFIIQTETRAVLQALTIYNPTKRQCDRSPLITASNSKIDILKLKNQEFRWMALSRDLLKRWKGKFHYGDTVLVDANDPAIDGFWIIKDTMNKRYKNHGDLLFDSRVRTLGKWKNVEISKIETVTFHPLLNSKLKFD
ncbi:MAG TPA: hypothetical protein VIY47_01770 [Ignavibacteriaceae bacterium]